MIARKRGARWQAWTFAIILAATTTEFASNPVSAADADVIRTIRQDGGGRIEFYRDGEIGCFDAQDRANFGATCRSAAQRAEQMEQQRTVQEKIFTLDRSTARSWLEADCYDIKSNMVTPVNRKCSFAAYEVLTTVDGGSFYSTIRAEKTGGLMYNIPFVVLYAHNPDGSNRRIIRLEEGDINVTALARGSVYVAKEFGRTVKEGFTRPVESSGSAATQTQSAAKSCSYSFSRLETESKEYERLGIRCAGDSSDYIIYRNSSSSPYHFTVAKNGFMGFNASMPFSTPESAARRACGCDN